MTPPKRNRRIVLAERPHGRATLSSFRLEQVPIPALRDGELLLRTLWLSLDPYMRGRMNDAPSYAAPVAIGDVGSAPGAFLGLLEGRNFGKLVVDVGGADT